MTKKTRKILFLVFLFLFLFTAPTAILYSQGYRFDFENRKFSQTGGIFLKILPKQAEVYLNGELTDKTDFFFNSLFIENLLPASYKVEVKKEGFHPWQKTLEVREKEVVEAKNVILFPENPKLSLLTSEVEDLWLSPDQKKLILKETGWALKLYSLEKNVKSHLIRENDISSTEADLLSLKFSEDSKEIFLEAGIAEKIRYFTLDLEQAPPSLTETEPSLPLIEDAAVYQQTKDGLYYLTDSGHLFRNEEKLSLTLFPVKQETEYKLFVFQNSIFLQEGQALYRFDPSLKSFENFFEETRGLEISPDNKKLLYFSEYEVWVSFLGDESPLKKAGDKVLLMRLSEKIKDCLWLNPYYLILSFENTAKISELDERDKVNVISLGEIKNPRVIWNESEKRLYLLSENNLLRSAPLLP